MNNIILDFTNFLNAPTGTYGLMLTNNKNRLHIHYSITEEFRNTPQIVHIVTATRNEKNQFKIYLWALTQVKISIKAESAYEGIGKMAQG